MIVTIVGLATSVAIFILILEKPIYQSDSKLLVIEEDKMSWLKKIAPLVGESRDEASEKFKTQILMMRSGDTIRKVVSEVNMKVTKDLRINSVMLRSFVRIFRKANIIVVEAKTTNPELSYQIADVYSKMVLQQNIEIYQGTATRVRKMVEKQLSNTRKKISKHEVILSKYKKGSNDINSRADKELLETIKKANQQIEKLKIDLKIAMRIKRDLEYDFNHGGEKYIKYLKSPILKNLVQKRELKKKEYDNDQYNLQVKQDLNKLDEKILQELLDVSKDKSSFIAGYYDRLQGQIKAQDATIRRINSMLAVYQSEKRSAYIIQKKEVGDEENLNSDEIERLLSFEQNNYNILVKKVHEARLAEELNVGNLKIIDKADKPSLAIHTGRKKKVVLVFLVSIILSVGFVLIINYIENIFDAYEELSYYKDLATPLGYIPLESAEPQLINTQMPRSLYVEAYKEISAKMALIYDYYRVITFSSVDNVNGGESVAINFAINEAMSGKKVALVDANYRRPSIAAHLEIANMSGLSEFVNGNSEGASLVNKTSVDNLVFINTGDVPGNPIDLFLHERFEAFIDNLKQKVDIIVLYLPPANLFSDSSIVAKKSDGVILIVQESVSRVSTFKSIIIKFKGVKIKTFGSIMYGETKGNNSKKDYVVNKSGRGKKIIGNILFYVTIIISIIGLVLGISYKTLDFYREKQIIQQIK